MRNRGKGITYKILFSRAFSPARRIFMKLLKDYLRSTQRGIVRIGDTFTLIEEVRREVEMLLGDDEARNIYLAVESTKRVPGDVAEAGVYKGGSAKLICEAKGDKALHLFDTFEGLPEGWAPDSPWYQRKFDSFLEAKQNLAKYKNVHFHKGLIPSTFDSVKQKSFSFVHLDVDRYESTSECLKFFYPRMSLGGIIISHDYPSEGGKESV